MNYIQKVREELAKELDWTIDPADKYTPLLDLYVLLVFTTGTNTTLEHIHDAWSVWCNVHEDDKHRSLKPFEELSNDVQELDRKYCEAVIKVAGLIT